MELNKETINNVIINKGCLVHLFENGKNVQMEIKDIDNIHLNIIFNIDDFAHVHRAFVKMKQRLAAKKKWKDIKINKQRGERRWK